MKYTTIASLYKDYTDKSYINNAEKAEEIYKAIHNVRKLGTTKNGVDSWVEDVCKALGANSNVEKAIVMCFMTIKLNPLRLEFDEEYAEMQFV